ncbi:MAG: regulatory protein RecX [Candidatus Thioglobus sp.]|nr:MAG: regulatory protein RecX [Candidatus Thioglobus sp.]
MEASSADLQAQVRDRAWMLLARREHSVEELRQKLVQRGFESQAVDSVLADLKERGDISDVRFAETMISHRAKSGYGPAYIRQELRKKGITSDLVASALDSADICWREIATLKYTARFAGESILDYKEWTRRASYLKRRGFDSQIIVEILGEWETRG